MVKLHLESDLFRPGTDFLKKSETDWKQGFSIHKFKIIKLFPSRSRSPDNVVRLTVVGGQGRRLTTGRQCSIGPTWSEIATLLDSFAPEIFLRGQRR